jgi:hypothetical protein
MKTRERYFVARETGWAHHPLEEGYYYRWAAETTEPGLLINERGDIYVCGIRGRGRFAYFPAYPGDCDVVLKAEIVPAKLLQDELDFVVEALEAALNEPSSE